MSYFLSPSLSLGSSFLHMVDSICGQGYAIDACVQRKVDLNWFETQLQL